MNESVSEHEQRVWHHSVNSLRKRRLGHNSVFDFVGRERSASGTGVLKRSAAEVVNLNAAFDISRAKLGELGQ